LKIVHTDRRRVTLIDGKQVVTTDGGWSAIFSDDMNFSFSSTSRQFSAYLPWSFHSIFCKMR